MPEDGDAAELHQVAADIAAGRRADLADPGLYEAIMGKPDATLMREAVEAALDETKTEDDRVCVGLPPPSTPQLAWVPRELLLPA